jgi:lysophospholipase L1-like esterase
MIHHAAKVALAPILYAQARRLRRSAIELPEPEGPRAGVEGAGPLRLHILVTGDSSAAGVGADTQDEALARPLARLLAARLAGRVDWRLIARTGLTSEGVYQLLQSEPVARADLAVVIVGVNDLTSEVPLRRALHSRARIAHWLRANAATKHVLFTSMPEMQHFPLIPQPLAWYAGLHARRNNRLQARFVRTLPGAAHVDLRGLVRVEWMARDGYHPAPPLYAQLAARLSDTVAALVEN